MSPFSLYAASKKAGELMAYSYHKLYQMDVSVVFGILLFLVELGRPDMSLYRFIKWIAEEETIQMFEMVLNPVILLMWTI